jgi:hypothetical protein
MKVRTLIAIAASSLLATSLVYAAPSVQLMADDNSTMDSNGASAGTAPGPGSTDNLGNDQSNSVDQTPADTGAGTGNSNDDSSADTATGDDDY